MEKAEDRRNSEKEIIRRCTAGDRQAFRELVNLFQGRVFSLLYRLVRRREDVEDLAQEVFLKVHISLGSYDGRSPFGTWLGRITINHAYDYLRRQRTRQNVGSGPSIEEVFQASEIPSSGTSADQIPVDKQLALKDLVGKLLERAPAKERILLTLKEMEGFSIREISELLDLKPATVKVQLLRARRRMLEDFRRLVGKRR